MLGRSLQEMPFHYDQKLSLPDGGPFRLMEWKVENQDDRGFWCQCAPGQIIATLETEAAEFEVICLFQAAITKLFVKEGDEVTQNTFFLQWVADGENLPRSGKDFEVRPKQESEQEHGERRLTRPESKDEP